MTNVYNNTRNYEKYSVSRLFENLTIYLNVLIKKYINSIKIIIIIVSLGSIKK